MKPFTSYEDPIAGARSEIISAQSSLNMPAEPVPKEKLHPDAIFLAETDEWAKHAMGHLRAAFKLLIEAEKERDELRGELLRLLRR